MMPFHKTGSDSLHFSAAGAGGHLLLEVEIARMIISAILSWWEPRR